MVTAKLAFYKDDVIEDTHHFYDPLTKTLHIYNQKEVYLNITYDEYCPEHLTIDVKDSSLTMIEEYQGEVSFNEIQLKINENSKVLRIGLYVDITKDIHFIRKVYNHGYYRNVQLDLCDCSLKIDEQMELLTPNSKCDVFTGLYAQNNNNKTYNTNFKHLAKQTQSDCKIFGVCNDFAQMTIATDAYIVNGAISSKATQEGRIINLVETAKGVILPELHIDENDVEAAHSCSVGSVNLDHLYYLQSRGFSQEEGKNLLIKSYFTPIYQFISDEILKEKMEQALEKRIG